MYVWHGIYEEPENLLTLSVIVSDHDGTYFHSLKKKGTLN